MDIVRDVLGIETLAEEDDLIMDLGADSSSLLQILAKIEDFFDTDIHPSKLPFLNSVAAVCDVLDESAASRR